MHPKLSWPVLIGLTVAKVALHLIAIRHYGFHRDELLYENLGEHLAWGYWSNPPLIGWISAATQALAGDSVVALRMPALLAGLGILWLTLLMVREIGGRTWAQALAGIGILACPPFLRSAHLFQPVVFDLFWWTVLLWLVVGYLRRRDRRQLLYFGIAFGFGLLNKYSVGFLLLALLPAIWLRPAEREVFRYRATGLAALLALLIVLPNLLWQYAHGFPVVSHMQALAANQLVNVTVAAFTLDQLIFNFPAIWLWPLGLVWYWKAEAGRYRLLAYWFVFLLLLFILFSGKSYYTLGAYPLLFAGGARWWEARAGAVGRSLAIAFTLIVGGLMLPISLPIYSLERMVVYCRALVALGVEPPLRWEDGQIHDLPQDYADMLGWPELARQVARAYARLPADEPVLIYAENYGQAAAINHFNEGKGLPAAVSFSDAFRLWLPPTTSARALIYINDELGPDVQALFADIQVVGTVVHPHARERGTRVYLCRSPRQDVGTFWRERVAVVTGE